MCGVAKEAWIFPKARMISAARQDGKPRNILCVPLSEIIQRNKSMNTVPRYLSRLPLNLLSLHTYQLPPPLQYITLSIRLDNKEENVCRSDDSGTSRQ